MGVFQLRTNKIHLWVNFTDRDIVTILVIYKIDGKIAEYTSLQYKCTFPYCHQSNLQS